MKLSPNTFDTDALDWLQDSMFQTGTRHYKLEFLESAKEPYRVLAYDPKQKRHRFSKGKYLRIAIERAVAIEEGAE